MTFWDFVWQHPWELLWRLVVAVGASVVISRWVRDRWPARKPPSGLRCVVCRRLIEDPAYFDADKGPVHMDCFLSQHKRPPPS